MGKFEELGKKVGSLVDEKDQAYGNSFDICGDFLKLLWPNGCPPEQYGNLLAFARMFDKMKRIATDADAFGESPWQDISGYGLLGLNKALNELKTSLPEKMSAQEIIQKAKELEEKYKKAAMQNDMSKDLKRQHETGRCQKSCLFCLQEDGKF